MAPTQIFAMRLAGARIDEVGPIAVSVEDVGFRTGQIGAVTAGELLRLGVVARDHDVAAIEDLAPCAADAEVLPTAVERYG